MAENNDFGMGYAMGQDAGNRNGGMFGGGWGEGLWAIIILAMLGFGNRGFGGWGNGGESCDTRAAISDGFALNGLDNGIRGVQQGLCDGFYAMNTGMLNGFNSVNVGVLQGFNGVQSQLCNMAAQQQACCCETQRLIERGFCDTNYNLATQSCETRNLIQNTTRDLIDNQNANTGRILDFLVQDKIQSLQAENNDLRRAASQDRQNAYFTTAMQAQTDTLINRLAPYPVPAFNVPAPYPYCGSGYGSGYGFHGGCGCGC